MDDLVNLLVTVESNELPAQALVEWAMKEIERGNDSDSLNELAWLNNPNKEEAIQMFVASTKELNYILPSVEEKNNLLARRIASNMEKGIKDLNEGCSELCEISMILGSPKSLSIFELLAHEQYDHECIGITAENIRPNIVNEVRRYLNET